MPDKYANKATVNVIESAANTLTFNQLQTGVSVFEKMAFVVHEIRYEFSISAVNLIIGMGDSLTAAIVRSSQLTQLGMGQPEVLDKYAIYCTTHGAPASALHSNPAIGKQDFTGFPGGGLLIPGAPIYAAVEGTGLADPGDCTITFYFTTLTLKADEYWELVEAYRIIS